ncbi:SGNH/GDSL hydrolase family protein [Nonomuraea sediminis]|uniref:SGNH/GDSL hydrolase family protein n=1 Tax=Nonomuraea sediminis TaxID=2835864 RepID=UPI001BDD21BE|nr:SGNH/GDSL hydrolase family protein [Nonomuraea sediminis]
MNTERLIRFQQPQKVLGYLGRLDEERVAGLFGLDLEAYRGILQAFDASARQTAEELLAVPGFAEKVDRLPFEPGQRVAAVGESTTADLQSWFEILRHLLALRRPGDGISLVNLAVSGQTTTQALAALPGLYFQRPDWVLCMLGGNDAMRVAAPHGPTQVSIAETERNLRALEASVPARWVWVAPTAVDEARVAAYQPFQQARLTWANDDVAAVAKVMPATPVVAEGADLIEDGVHLSPAGQRAVAAAVVDALS